MHNRKQKIIRGLLKEAIGKEAGFCNQTKNQIKPLKNQDATIKEDSVKLKYKINRD